MISKKLGNHFSYDFLEVIKIKHLKVKPYDLKAYSLIFTSVNAVDAFFENGFMPNENFVERDFNKIYAVGLQTKRELRKNGFGTFKVAKHAKQQDVHRRWLQVIDLHVGHRDAGQKGYEAQ